jgi:metal-responsive CopG/Arc/MetJ family transcriptional regulator
MKSKTSITLSSDVLQEIDKYAMNSGNRSAFIEKAVWCYLVSLKKGMRDKTDLEILNNNAHRLNKEAEDVLTYQIEI